MNKREYIRKGVVLHGHGRIKTLVLDETFFNTLEKIHGEIMEA